MKQKREQDQDNQKFFKKTDKFNRGSDKFFRWFYIVLGGILVVLAFGTFAVNAVRGTATLEQFTLCCVALLFLVAVPLCVKLIRLLNRWIYRKDIAFNPNAMVLPERGTVTLNGALHKMSMPVGAVVWVVFLGCIVFALLFVLLAEDVEAEPILRGVVGVTLGAVVGYLLLLQLWKKRSFVKKMIKNTKKRLPEEVYEGYGDSVEASLNRGVLSYEKELIMTEDYILGSVESDTSFVPVAVPRAKITGYVFFYRRIVGGRYSRTIGILSCKVNGETEIEFVIGQHYQAQKILQILDHYQILWTEKSTSYRPC